MSAASLKEVLRGARAGILWSFAILLLTIAASMLLKGQDERTATEHRLTAVETKLDSIQRDLQDFRQYGWMAMLGLAGLLGEAGLRIVRKKGTM